MRRNASCSHLLIRSLTRYNVRLNGIGSFLLGAPFAIFFTWTFLIRSFV